MLPPSAVGSRPIAVGIKAADRRVLGLSRFSTTIGSVGNGTYVTLVVSRSIDLVHQVEWKTHGCMNVPMAL